MAKLSNGQLDELWRQFNATHGAATRAQLITHYIYLVRNAAGALRANLVSHIDREDLTSAGYVGLLQAIDRFDPHRARFVTYATKRIRGAMVDYIRDNDWVSRSVRSGTKQITRARKTLCARLGRNPTDAELAKSAKLTLRRYAEIVRSPQLSTSVPQEHTAISIAHPVESLELWDVVAKYTTGDYLYILRAHFSDGLTLGSIAKTLGISHFRVARKFQSALSWMRDSGLFDDFMM